MSITIITDTRNATSCLYKYLDKKETEASPVSDREVVLGIAQRHFNNVHEREIQKFKMT